MSQKKPIKIFLVEDNKTMAVALKTYIETSFTNTPIMIHTFETGEKCMEKVKVEKPQIVILDYHLDSKIIDAANGIKVLAWIKKESKNTHVIMLTREDNIDIAVKSYNHGASDYIVKTDTQFRKIIFSLYNLFRIMESKSDALRYKYIAFGVIISIAILIITLISIQILDPRILM